MTYKESLATPRKEIIKRKIKETLPNGETVSVYVLLYKEGRKVTELFSVCAITMKEMNKS